MNPSKSFFFSLNISPSFDIYMKLQILTGTDKYTKGYNSKFKEILSSFPLT